LTRAPQAGLIRASLKQHLSARIAQSVEQGIENPRVGGSIPPPGTTNLKACMKMQAFFIARSICLCCANCRAVLNKTPIAAKTLISQSIKTQQLRFVYCIISRSKHLNLPRCKANLRADLS
jgi:hypothetical protein